MYNKPSKLWWDEIIWHNYGIENSFNEYMVTAIVTGDDKKARSLLTWGKRNEWAFPFVEKVTRAGKWPNSKIWKKHGIENFFNEYMVTAIVTGGDKKARSWFVWGKGNGWDFPFETQISPNERWPTEEKWRDYGIENAIYQFPSENLVTSNPNREFRSWYRVGNEKKWTGDFSFIRKLPFR